MKEPLLIPLGGYGGLSSGTSLSICLDYSYHYCLYWQYDTRRYPFLLWINFSFLIHYSKNYKNINTFLKLDLFQYKKRFRFFYFIPKSSSSTSICFNISSVVVNPDITLYNPSCNIVITSLLYTRLLSSSFLIPALIASLIS